MSALVESLRGARLARRGLDAALVVVAGVLLVAAVGDVGRQAHAIDRERADVRVFLHWAEPFGGRSAFGRVRTVQRGRTTDVVCAAPRGSRGRLCLAVRRHADAPRVVGAVRVAPGGHAIHRRRLVCPRAARAARTCVVGPGAARPGAVRP
jgi:hypothetical protein